MAPMKAMKAMKAGGSKVMTKGALLKLIATENEMKTKDCSNILNSLVTVATKEVKKTGIFTIPGICRIKTRTRPATKARVVMMFGEEKHNRYNSAVSPAIVSADQHGNTSAMLARPSGAI